MRKIPKPILTAIVVVVVIAACIGIFFITKPKSVSMGDTPFTIARGTEYPIEYKTEVEGSTEFQITTKKGAKVGTTIAGGVTEVASSVSSEYISYSALEQTAEALSQITSDNSYSNSMFTISKTDGFKQKFPSYSDLNFTNSGKVTSAECEECGIKRGTPEEYECFAVVKTEGDRKCRLFLKLSYVGTALDDVELFGRKYLD